jgi:long-chain fatty acid transport protein
MTHRHLWVWASCVGIWWVLSGTALADGLSRDGVGAISTGRGGTNIAHSDNGAVILDNPAGLVNFESQNFAEFGVDTIITKLRYDDHLNDVGNSTQPLPIPEIAYIRTSDDGKWAAGIGLFAPTGFGASYQLQDPVFGPGPHRYRSFGAVAKILPALSYRVTDRLSVGGTIGAAISRVELDSPFFLQTGPFAGTPAIFDLRTTGAAMVWSLGLQYDIGESTTIGLAYNSDSNFGLHGKLFSHIVGLGPMPVPANFDARLSIDFPQTFGVGIKHVINDQHRISADVIYYGWHNAFDALGLRLTNGSNPLLTALLGPTIHDSIALNWSDSVSVRTGYEYKATEDDVWRVGYVYHPSPVPSNTLNPLVDGVLEHAVSLGYSHQWDSWILNLAYQYSFSPVRSVGESILAGGNFDNSRFKAEAHWISISLVHTF